MIPSLLSLQGNRDEVLPEGIYETTLLEVEDSFAFNPRRKFLFGGLVGGIHALSVAGCRKLYINGSFVTSKIEPSDYDVAWDPEGVNAQILDPVFIDIQPPRLNQKAKFRGEFLPTKLLQSNKAPSIVKFFQQVRNSSFSKGILRIDPVNDPWFRSERDDTD